MIKVNQCSVHAGEFALHDISFEIPSGSYGVLMGRTGCGKTTLLEAVCGLKRVSSGTIELMGRDVTLARPGDRGIGFVPQDIALFNSMSVREHLSFGPTIRGWARVEIDTLVDELAADLGITALLERRPAGLSGGERQRVALGRAVSTRPRVLCLDEPLSALDEDTHQEISELIQHVTREHDITTLHITHSRRESEYFADILLCLQDGEVSTEKR